MGSRPSRIIKKFLSAVDASTVASRRSFITCSRRQALEAGSLFSWRNRSRNDLLRRKAHELAEKKNLFMQVVLLERFNAAVRNYRTS
jgi:hypothetical protein